jgi:ribosomal protein S27E
LLHADWICIQTGQNSRDKFMASGQHVVVTGEVIGIYLFRRDDTRVDRATRPKALEQNRESVPATISENGDVVRVKCFKCQHAQDVPAAQQSFVCEQCGEKLKRKVAAT